MLNHTLNISGILEGFVLDHIPAGKGMEIYKYLNLENFDYCIAIIKNAKSRRMGKKDIIKIECPIDSLNLGILGFIDQNITVNVVKNETIVEKKKLDLPDKIVNIIRCKNPRCVTSIEHSLDQIFILTDRDNETYRCKYCEEHFKK